MAETEGYHQLIQRQVQDLSGSIGTTEVANQLRDTARTMLEALRQCISVIKDSQLSKSESMVVAVRNLSSSVDAQTTHTVDGAATKGLMWKEVEEVTSVATEEVGVADGT